MGGEFSPPQSEKSEKSNIIYQILFQYLRDKKKKQKKGAQKREGGENSSISPLLDPRLELKVRVGSLCHEDRVAFHCGLLHYIISSHLLFFISVIFL